VTPERPHGGSSLGSEHAPAGDMAHAPAGDMALAPAGDIELSIVVPYYNPGPALAGNLRAIVATLEATGLGFEVVAVSDGSTDGSPEDIAAAAGHRLRLLALPSHVGKGEALRMGLREGRGRYVGFIDADGDIPFELLGTFLGEIRTGSVDIVIGSKRHPASDVVYPPLRRLYSWGYQQLVRLLFRLDVRDTQTGIKILRREVLESVLPQMFEKRFAFDLELLVVAKMAGYDRIAELPVRIGKRFHSTISMAAVLGIVADTLTIWWRLRVRRSYGRHDRPG